MIIWSFLSWRFLVFQSISMFLQTLESCRAQRWLHCVIIVRAMKPDLEAFIVGPQWHVWCQEALRNVDYRKPSSSPQSWELLYQTASANAQPVGNFLLLFLVAVAFLLVKHFIISSRSCDVAGVIQLLCELV